MRSEAAVHWFPLTGRGAATWRGWPRFRLVALLAGVVAVVGGTALLPALPGETPAPTTTTRHGLTSLPLAAQGPVSAALGRDGRPIESPACGPSTPHSAFARASPAVASRSSPAPRSSA